MKLRPAVVVGPGTIRGRVTVTHPNDQDLQLEVKHAPGARVRLETDESAYSGSRSEQRTTVLTVPAEALMLRVGRMDATLYVDDHVTPVLLDLLAPPAQARNIRDLIDSLVLTPLALLAMPRSSHRLERDGEGERDRVENLKEAGRLFDEASQLLAAHPPTRIRAIEAETPPGTRLTAAVVQAIANQPYTLEPATPGPATVRIRGRHYTTRSLHAPVPTEDTDTPANRFVHGVGLALERLMYETLTDLADEHHALVQPATPIEGYVSIRQLTANQAAEVAKTHHVTLEKVLSEVRLARARLEKRLPVRAANRALTTGPIVLHDPRYARVRRTLDLLRTPARDLYGAEGLVAGITSLATLYELYCLAVLHDLLGQRGYQLSGYEHDPTSGPAQAPHVLRDGQRFPNTLTYNHEHLGELTMLYEPRITRDAHPRAGLVCVSAGSHNLTPDIVISTPSSVIVFDAKFRPSPPRELLADATLKYLHGLRPTGNRTLLGLHLLHYSSDAQPYDFHVQPITPAISTVPTHPSNWAPLSSVLDRHFANAGNG